MLELKILKAYPGVHFNAEGFGNDRGTDTYNLKLGFERASNVRNEAIRLGVPADRMTASSFGKGFPLCRESDESCREQNRRVRLGVEP